MKFDTVEKAKRILPSFVMHLANGDIDLNTLRARVVGESRKLDAILANKLTYSPFVEIDWKEIAEIDRKRIQLSNFLDLVK